MPQWPDDESCGIDCVLCRYVLRATMACSAKKAMTSTAYFRSGKLDVLVREVHGSVSQGALKVLISVVPHHHTVGKALTVWGSAVNENVTVMLPNYLCTHCEGDDIGAP